MKRTIWLVLLWILLLIPMSVSAFQNEAVESSFSVTASKSEIFPGDTIELTIKASGVDAVRLWDGKSDKMLREFSVSGDLGLGLSVQVNVPGTAIYYLTSAKDGSWSKDRSERAMVRVKAPQNSGAPNVIPAKSESDFLGTWRIKYAGIPSGGSYQIAAMSVENDMPFMFSPGFLTVGDLSPSETSFEDGILFTKQGTFELTDKGFLSNYQAQGFNAYLEKVSDEYPAAPAVTENPSKTEEEPEKYTGVSRPMTAEIPKTVQAAGEDEFFGKWELCYAFTPGNTTIFSTALLGEDAKAYYYIHPGFARYETPSDYSIHDYSPKFVSGKLDLGTAILSMNDNGMISEEIKGNILYFCKVDDPEPAAERPDPGSSEDYTSDTAENSDLTAEEEMKKGMAYFQGDGVEKDDSQQSGDVVLTVDPTEVVVGGEVHVHAEAPGAERIALNYNGTDLYEQTGDVFDSYSVFHFEPGTINLSAVAYYKGSGQKTSNVIAVTLLEKPDEGAVYTHSDDTNLEPADVYTVDMPSKVAANESFRITINPQKDNRDFIISLYDPKWSAMINDETVFAGTLEIKPLPAGSYRFVVVENGGSYRNLPIDFLVVEGENTESPLRFTPGSEEGVPISAAGSEEEDKADDQGPDMQAVADFLSEGISAFNELQRGYAYYNGDGVEKDPEQAVYWWTQAAEHGNPEAMHALGVVYSDGEVVTQDLEKGLYWYQKASDAGYATSQANLGNMYENGIGVDQDSEQAVYWYQKAAEGGDAVGQHNLGVMYTKGIGIGKDLEQALYWFQKAADQGYVWSQYNLGVMYLNGEGVEPDYEQALTWYQKAADQGYDQAQIGLGQMYMNGTGVEQNYEQAAYWFQKAAEQGNVQVQSLLGQMYAAGDMIDQDYEKAAYWFQKAAEAGDIQAQNNLAGMYYAGAGVERDYAQTAYWLQKAADQGDARAQNNLGSLYENGYGVEQQDLEQALYWYQKSADQGYMWGQASLGSLYENGKGVEQDLEQAADWYQKAADQGFEYAAAALENLHAKVKLTASHDTIEVGKTLTVTVSAPGAAAVRLYDSLSADPEKPLKEAEGDTLEYRRIAVNSSEGSYYAAASYDGEWSEKSKTAEVTFLPASRLRVNCPQTANAGEDFRITIYETANTEEYSLKIRDASENIVRRMSLPAGTANIASLPKGKYTVTVTCVGNEDRTMTLPLEVN